jgi:CheY-like chemotaxis protein
MEGARRGAALTKRLLAFGRRQPLSPSTLDVNTLVSGMSELLRHSLGAGIQIETVLGGGLWRTYADATELESAIANLAINSRDAMPQGGKLTVETMNSHIDEIYISENPDAAPGQYVLIAVTDNGAGMPPEVLKHAFDPFFTTKGVGQGSGLGLSQIYGFLKQSGGHAKIYSELGRGTTVKLYLPRQFDAHQVTGEGQTEPTSGPVPARGDESILVVEDEAGVRLVAVEALRELGYQVLEAEDGASALRLLEEGGPANLLFTDVVMPGMTGRELADQAAHRWPEMKILYTTGFTRNAIVHGGQLDPGVDLLPKPYTLQELSRKVRLVLDAPIFNTAEAEKKQQV